MRGVGVGVRIILAVSLVHAKAISSEDVRDGRESIIRLSCGNVVDVGGV